MALLKFGKNVIIEVFATTDHESEDGFDEFTHLNLPLHPPPSKDF